MDHQAPDTVLLAIEDQQGVVSFVRSKARVELGEFDTWASNLERSCPTGAHIVLDHGP